MRDPWSVPTSREPPETVEPGRQRPEIWVPQDRGSSDKSTHRNPFPTFRSRAPPSSPESGSGPPLVPARPALPRQRKAPLWSPGPDGASPGRRRRRQTGAAPASGPQGPIGGAPTWKSAQSCALPQGSHRQPSPWVGCAGLRLGTHLPPREKHLEDPSLCKSEHPQGAPGNSLLGLKLPPAQSLSSL